MIIKKSNLRLSALALIYILAIASNNITIPGYGRPSILLHIFLFGLIIYLYFFYSTRPTVLYLPKFLKFIFFILIISSIINSFVINDYRILITYISFIVLFLSVSKFSLEITDSISGTINTTIIFKVILWINLIIIFLSLFFDGLYIYRYQGIFDRSNSMGRFAGCSFIFSLICIFFLDKEKFLKIISIIVMSMSFMFLILTQSRTPILATLISFLMIMGTYAIIKKKKIKFFIVLTVFTLLGFQTLSYYFPEIIAIFEFKFNRGDGTSGRLNLWNSGLNYYNFFGSTEYNNISYKDDVHNNYLSQTLKYGIINSICFHIIPFYFLFKSFKKMIILRVLDKNLAVIVGMTSFLIPYYFFETASLIAPFWLMLIFTSISYKKIFNNEKKN